MSRHLTVPIKPQGNVTTATAAENILNRQVVAYDADGDVIVASKDNVNKVNVIGFATNTYSIGESVSVQTFGTIDGFTSLDAGEPVYLDANGDITQLISDIATDEYRVFLGFATSQTEIFISIQEATLNSATSSLVTALRPKVYIKSTDFTMVQSDMSYINTSVYYETGASNYTLAFVSSPNSIYIGATVKVQKTDDGAGYVTITNTGLTEDPEITLQNEIKEYQWDGTQWRDITSASSASTSSYNIGDVFYSANSSLGRADGAIAFGSGPVSQSDFAELYAVVGDSFETAWTDLGYSASGAGNFYGAPPVGVYGRTAIPRAQISTSEVDTANNRIDDPNSNTFAFHILKDGTPVILSTDDTAPGGITAGTTYYARLVNSNQSIEFYDTAAHAIDDSGTTGRVTITSTGTGPHYIHNAGVRLDDAFQGHEHYVGHADNTDSSYAGYDSANSSGGEDRDTKEIVADGTNGTPRTTNETRPDTILLYAYIKASHVTPTGEAVSALRSTTGWVSNSDWTAKELPFTHNLNAGLSDLIVKIFISSDGTDANAIEVHDYNIIYDLASPQNLSEVNGITLYCTGQNSVSFYTGQDGVRYHLTNGASILLSNQTYYYKIVVYKPNILANYTGSRNTVISIADATDQTVAIPSASSIDYPIFIKRVGSGSGVVNLSFQAGEDETDVTSLVGDGGYIELIASGGKWYIRNHFDRYETAWTARSDWAGESISVAHGLGAHLDKLKVRFLLSVASDGSDAREIFDANRDAGSSFFRGFSVYYSDDDTISIETAEDGITFVSAGGGAPVSFLGATSAYYKAIVEVSKI